jgi:hypothetical protein
MTPLADSTGSRTPTIDAIQRDVALANTYRIELIKFLLGIAAALFAFTVTFRPTLVRVDFSWAMWVGWIGLALSMIGGVFHMLGWDHYYKSYRDHDWRNTSDPVAGKEEGKRARAWINHWRRIALVLQFAGFFVGVACTGFFSAVNLANVRVPIENSAATKGESQIIAVPPVEALPVQVPKGEGEKK